MSTLAAYFVFGVFGLSIFNLGRKQQKPIPLVCGIVLMVYPYFVDNVYWLWGIGAVVLAIGIRALTRSRY